MGVRSQGTAIADRAESLIEKYASADPATLPAPPEELAVDAVRDLRERVEAI
ncbi:hypothetical protein GCM10009557_33020 [Virgisporangium ochraceum]|uniref:Uncharacterized protein n=1 Tax=Virgisporangium ochraceum TaxID=65505 RepID=A0A8J3ZZQ0_9ACTN|nr:hypothetical protein [Virgisporangium ochraceum]GIJ71475.1 hypothetical protein Voc01_063920 [Virgisporangium ochraceum]